MIQNDQLLGFAPLLPKLFDFQQSQERKGKSEIIAKQHM